MSFRVPAFSALGPGEHFPRRHLQYFSGWKTVAAEAREVGGPQPGVWAPYTQSSVPGPCPLSVRAAALLRRPRNAPAGSERPVPENRDLGKRRVSSGTGSFRDVGAPGPLPTAYPPPPPSPRSPAPAPGSCRVFACGPQPKTSARTPGPPGPQALTAALGPPCAVGFSLPSDHGCFQIHFKY